MVVVFGSVNLDLIFAVPALPRPGETVLGPATRVEPGGKGANQAVAAARDGAAVVMAGAVGTDVLSSGALTLLRDAGVEVSRVRAIGGASTGCAAIATDPSGVNAICVGSGANLLAVASQVEDALLSPSATLVLQMETAPPETAALIRRGRTRGARVILNLAPAAALPLDALRSLDLLVVNAVEADWLAASLGVGADAAALRSVLGVDVVRTRGAEGAEAATGSGLFHMPARPIRAVDTTAAGDCFVGVLAAALDRGAPLRDGMRRAMTAAALCCTRPGSQSSLPLAVEIDADGAGR